MSFIKHVIGNLEEHLALYGSFLNEHQGSKPLILGINALDGPILSVYGPWDPNPPFEGYIKVTETVLLNDAETSSTPQVEPQLEVEEGSRRSRIKYVNSFPKYVTNLKRAYDRILVNSTKSKCCSFVWKRTIEMQAPAPSRSMFSQQRGSEFLDVIKCGLQAWAATPTKPLKKLTLRSVSMADSNVN